MWFLAQKSNVPGVQKEWYPPAVTHPPIALILLEKEEKIWSRMVKERKKEKRMIATFVMHHI